MQKAMQDARVVIDSQQGGPSVPRAALGFYVGLSPVLATAQELGTATFPISRMRTGRPTCSKC